MKTIKTKYAFEKVSYVVEKFCENNELDISTKKKPLIILTSNKFKIKVKFIEGKLKINSIIESDNPTESILKAFYPLSLIMFLLAVLFQDTLYLVEKIIYSILLVLGIALTPIISKVFSLFFPGDLEIEKKANDSEKSLLNYLKQNLK